MRANVILLATLLLLGATASASDDSFAAGKEAFDRGDFDQAIALLEAPAKAGDMRAQYGFGRLLLARAEMRGLVWIRKSAEGGFLPAQLDMVERHFACRLVPPDPAQVMRWLRRATNHDAARAGPYRRQEAGAHLFFGQAYELGLTGTPDRAKAMEHYQRAADSGLAAAQYHFATQLLDWDSDKVDYVRAHTYFVLAWKQDFVWTNDAGRVVASAKEKALELRRVLKGPDVEASKRQVRAWMAAKEKGELGWIFGQERDHTVGAKQLMALEVVEEEIHSGLLEAVMAESCQLYWTKSRAVVAGAPGSTSWTEDWVVESCGGDQTFRVAITKVDGAFRWKISPVKAPDGEEGAESLEALRLAARVGVVNRDFRALVRLVVPDERPYMSANLIAGYPTLAAFMLHAAHGKHEKEFKRKAEEWTRAHEAVLAKHGIADIWKRAPLPEELTVSGYAAWIRRVAPDLDHVRFITDMLQTKDKLRAREMGPPVLADFLPFTFPLESIERDGDVVTGTASGTGVPFGGMGVRFEKHEGRWYLAPAADYLRGP